MSDDHPAYEQHPFLHQAGEKPTADAAKLNARAERALRHLPEIAEILDRDNDRPIVAEEARLAAALIRDLIAENTRPQPAPPAGELDLRNIARRLAEECFEFCANRETTRATFVDDLYAALLTILDERLGRAARPKVKDAEVAAAITYLGDEVPEEKAIADLLERLASELVTAKGGWEGAMDKWNHALNAGALLKANLAEREAELAKADAVIEAMNVNAHFTPAHALEAIARHAARQRRRRTVNE